MATEAAGSSAKESTERKDKNRERKTLLQERRRKTFSTLTGLLMEGVRQTSKRGDLSSQR
jgi:hypothetical protein